MAKKDIKKQKAEVSGEKQVSRLPKFGLAEEVLKTANPTDDMPKTEKKAEENAKVQEVVEAQEVKTEEEVLIKYVTFFLGNEEYGLPISHVQEINRVTEITRVPNSPEHVQGVINLRGRIVPVIELKYLLQIGATEIGKHSRIVLAEYGAKLLGFVVDRVAQVIDIAPKQIDEAPEEVRKSSENFVRGIGKVDERMIILLELDNIVQGKKIIGAQLNC